MAYTQIIVFGLKRLITLKESIVSYLNVLQKEDELTQHLKSSFSENIDTLKRELETWLGSLKVNEEE